MSPSPQPGLYGQPLVAGQGFYSWLLVDRLVQDPAFVKRDDRDGV
jgi:hypothetical protein